MKPRLLITESDAYGDEELSLLRSVFDVEVCQVSSQDQFKTLLKSVQPTVILVGLGLSVGSEEVGALTQLKVVATPTTGSDHIDRAELKKRGISCITLQDVKSDLNPISSTAELAWGLVLSVARHIPTASEAVLRGEWRRRDYLGVQLRGKNLGIIGLGRLGGYVAEYGVAFGMNVLAFDVEPKRPNPKIAMVSLNDVLAQSDVISVHVPLNARTMKLIGRDEFLRMKHGVLLVNTSRGDIFDEIELASLIRSGHIGAYGTDVIAGDTSWIEEVGLNPIIALRNDGFNVITTPHIGGYTSDAVRFTRNLVVQKLIELKPLLESK
jgi:D-3-phosphoglycerate dehydrogenase